MPRNIDKCHHDELGSPISFSRIGHPIGGKKKGEAISLDCKSRSQS